MLEQFTRYTQGIKYQSTSNLSRIVTACFNRGDINFWTSKVLTVVYIYDMLEFCSFENIIEKNAEIE